MTKVKGLRSVLYYLRRIAVKIRKNLPKQVQIYVFGMPRGCEKTHVYCSKTEQTYSVVRKDEKERRQPPETPEAAVHWKFCQDKRMIYHHPDVWLAQISNALIVGQDAHVITDTQTLLTDASIQFGLKDEYKNHVLFEGYAKLPKQQHIPGISAIINGPNARTYFHWLLDALPRIGILNQCTYELAKVDTFFIPQNNLPAISESLDLLGISTSRCQELRHNLSFRSEHLLLSSMPGNTGNPPYWAWKFLRDSFLRLSENVPDIYPQRFFISRKDTRRLLNESEIMSALNRRGISVIQPEKLSFIEQVALFARAELVVAPHGAALANLVFSPKTTSVVELFSPNYVNVCFWTIANLGGLRYSYLEGEGERPAEYFDPHLAREDILISPEKLELWLNSWL
ncbi:MAG: glycosyltransferase 61 family protein [Cyanobacteria bacterium P01_D01_bin.105]